MKNHRRGNYAVEFALTLPVLAMLALGVADYGWFFAQAQIAQVAARDAARTASKEKDTSAGETRGTALMTDGKVTGASTSCVVTSGADTDSDGTPDNEVSDPDVVTCTVTATYQPLLNFVPVPAQVSGSLTMAY